ncbi:hypothetical protein GCM10009801_52560 [Streptomyces albiaxialis]|uniref:Lipoprotein n=1 Tax=Streptomyces albiaxialis TaxID=329523 RepID=A0ABP5HX05_9ACTN
MPRALPPRTTAALAVLVLALVPTAGCGGDESSSSGGSGSSPSASPTRPPGALSKAELKKALLTEQDFPSGWAATDLGASDKAGDLGADNKQCQGLLDAVSGDKSRTEATRDFEKSESGPFVSNGVASYGKSGAKKALRDFKRLSSRCKGFTSKGGGGAVTFTVAPMTLPAFGDESAGLRLTGRAKGGPADGLALSMQLLVARVGPSTTGVAHMSVLGPDGKITSKLMRRAVERLRESAP